MSTTVPITTDTLPSNVPKLDVKGTNWAIFVFCFQVAVEAKELWSHFDGSSSPPTVSATPTAMETTALNKWRKDESLAKHLLTQRIPDSTALRIRSLTTVVDMWNEITKEYTEKGTYAQTDLRTQFLNSKLQKGVEVCHFLDGLHTKREELASVGVTIDEKDYRSTIIKSLPTSLANFASSQLAAAHLYSSTKTIAPNTLILIIIEEAKCQKVQGTSRSDHHDRDKDKDEALVAAPAGKSTYQSKGKQT